MRPYVRSPLVGLVAAALLLALAACGTGNGPIGPNQPQPPLPTTGGIAGTITTNPANAARADAGDRTAVPRLGDGAADFMAHSSVPSADVVSGEIIVRFEDAAALRSSSTLAVAGVHLLPVRELALPAARLYRAPVGSARETLAIASALAARPDVAYAHPNYRVHALLEPNDEFYAFQWHLPAINLPQAWDVTTGSAGIVVAVVDSGILFDANDPQISHPDLSGKVLPGYDFVSSVEISGDGTGRDPNPYDDGGGSGSHGTHVAGTIVAATNNGAGVAGVDWQARLVPVRALGVGGSGSLLDVIEGALWAAGFSVSGVPANANPAHVINMSLGGAYACTPFEQEAFTRIATESPRRAVVVVAAGNENLNAAGFSPAGCGDVITVGATETRDFRAPYSNFGTRVDVMAPGGDTSVDRLGNGFVDGVLSTDWDGTNLYTFLQGTSMAAPHVAGVVSLMKSLDPDLSTAQALAVLTATARPLSANACARPSAAECGAGLIDAAAAVIAVQTGQIPTPGGGVLAFAPNPLDFGTASVELVLTITNTAEVALPYAVVGYEPAAANPGTIEPNAVYVAAGAMSGELGPGGQTSVTLGIDRDLVTGEGSFAFELMFEAGGTQQRVLVRFTRGVTTQPTPSGPTIVAAFVDDGAGELALSGFEARGSFFTDYAFEATPGVNVVVAWVDENDDGEIDGNDFIGVHPVAVDVAAGSVTSGVHVVLERVVVGGGADEPWFEDLDLPDLWRVGAREP